MLRNDLAAPSAARGQSVHSFPQASYAHSASRSAIRRPATHRLNTQRLHGHRSLFEPLESRHLLSATVIEVTTTQDLVDPNDAFISLREAVLMANASPEDNEIVLAAGTYTLTRQGANENAGLTGDLDVVANGSLKISGAGRESTTINASGLYSESLGYGDRILHVLAGSVVTLERITLADATL